MAKETIGFQSVSPDFRPQLFHPKHMDTCRLNQKKTGSDAASAGMGTCFSEANSGEKCACHHHIARLKKMTIGSLSGAESRPANIINLKHLASLHVSRNCTTELCTYIRL